MNDELNYQIVALAIRESKLGIEELKRAFDSYLNQVERKEEIKVNEGNKTKVREGKQSLKQLKSIGDGLASVDISEENIKAFEKTARKYHIDFAVKKTLSKDDPMFIVFFKVKDTNVMEKAMSDFNDSLAKKGRTNQKPPLNQQLNEPTKAITEEKTVPKKERTRVREQIRQR